MRWVILTMIATLLLPGANVYGESFDPAKVPSLISVLKVQEPLEFCGERVPLEIQEVRERLEKELLLNVWDRPQVILWLKRSRRYLPIIEKDLKKSSMPDDLKYVAIAESALRPHVSSIKGAIGFWQFMKHTGRQYGLVINRRIDERRNIFASTKAALKCLKDFYDTFESWTLCVAAYNMGKQGIISEVLEQGTSDYYQLYLPIETQRFIFRILSVKLIISDPGKYGFKLGKQDYFTPPKFDQVRINCSREIPIRIIAQAAKTNFKTIKDLNPEIRGYRLAKGNHLILIPKGRSKNFHTRYSRIIKKIPISRDERVYTIKKGDILSAIADRFDVPLKVLLIWNSLDPKQPIHPGDRLTIHPKSKKPVGKSVKSGKVGCP